MNCRLSKAHSTSWRFPLKSYKNASKNPYSSYNGSNSWQIWTQKVPKEAWRCGVHTLTRIFSKMICCTWTAGFLRYIWLPGVFQFHLPITGNDIWYAQHSCWWNWILHHHWWIVIGTAKMIGHRELGRRGGGAARRSGRYDGVFAAEAGRHPTALAGRARVSWRGDSWLTGQIGRGRAPPFSAQAVH